MRALHLEIQNPQGVELTHDERSSQALHLAKSDYMHLVQLTQLMLQAQFPKLQVVE
jgi:hypothetical protein